MDYYNNIDDMTNLLYDFIYKPQKDYFCEKPKIDEIFFNDIIKNNKFDYSKILNNVDMENNIKLIDIIEEKIIIKKNMKMTYPLTLIIQKYNPKFQETLSIIDIYYELYINNLVYEYIIFDKIPFYLLNICNFNIYYDKLKSISDFKELVSAKFKNTSDKDKYCISVYEHYSSYITLKDLLTSKLTEYELLNILFQVLFAYSHFIYKIGSFRHNNFNIDCFLVEKLLEPVTLYLKSGDHRFKLKTSFICKLFDYRKAQIYLISNDIECDIDNPSYDIYTFLVSLYNFNNINNNKIKIIINELISEDIIKKNIKNENIFIKEYNGTILPNQLLIENNLFTRFIYMPTQQLKRSKLLKKNKNNSKKKTPLKRAVDTKKNKKINESIASSILPIVNSNKIKNIKNIKNKKKIVSSSSSDESDEDGIAKDDDNESIDDQTLDEEIDDEINDDDDNDDDDDDNDGDDDDDNSSNDDDDSNNNNDDSDNDEDNDDEDNDDEDNDDDLSGGLGTTDKKKINKLKNKINKIKNKYNVESNLNKNISKLKISKNNKSFGDFLGKNDNSSFINNNINGGIPLTYEELEKYNNYNKDDSNMNSPQQNMNSPQQNMNMFLQPQNMNSQQQNMNMFLQPQNMQYSSMNTQNPTMYAKNQDMGMQYLGMSTGENMLPIMNGGKEKLSDMPILSNFFFHHK